MTYIFIIQGTKYKPTGPWRQNSLKLKNFFFFETEDLKKEVYLLYIDKRLLNLD